MPNVYIRIFKKRRASAPTHKYQEIVENATFTPAHDEIPLDASKTTSDDVMALPLTMELSLESSSVQIPKVNFLQDEQFNVYGMIGQSTDLLTSGA